MTQRSGEKNFSQSTTNVREAIKMPSSLASAVNNDFHGAINHYHQPHHVVPQHQFSSYGSSKKKDTRSIGLSVLTLLSFLFFLHILQQCIQEQIDSTGVNGPQVVIMQTKLAKEQRQKELKNNKNLHK
ncbi:uncharacterized protein LOC126750694 [Anthonomus grandis grandis]|uniref:uncharacterized protein LOC126750694 n=1 Tax=Anthonomus grandis grandis TaxID=2921223 RepID=UPI002165B238|nr:uncharacterized protein LOC126750694 [Anthonomus grandis grandis]